MRIYLAGPMTGYPDHNFAAFDAAADSLARRGHMVFSPAAIARQIRARYEGSAIEIKMSEYAKAYLDAIFLCEAMYMLRGWERSMGAMAEHAVARWISMRIIYQGHRGDYTVE